MQHATRVQPPPPHHPLFGASLPSLFPPEPPSCPAFVRQPDSNLHPKPSATAPSAHTVRPSDG
eukprot:CAMPEP_0202418404 /NCGR_PEP_ID=MMETSP1128-20130828/46223_1 /ASSEMBLY_ACC=CAM_ASM_000463 /TAXON_ID=3047 /ORGANISM="Dunaliella tertiolecta, Strain CCMP1320" /LENGTH=62 /DNA_ID=CAMNT_0049026055 /DNA_START=1 /DNA_END=186 /DNA_ORIENTATION=+